MRVREGEMVPRFVQGAEVVYATRQNNVTDLGEVGGGQGGSNVVEMFWGSIGTWEMEMRLVQVQGLGFGV